MNRWMKFLRDCRDNYRDEVRLTKERQARKAAEPSVLMRPIGGAVEKGAQVLMFVLVGLFIGFAVFAFGCDNIKRAPKFISADGEPYVACRDFVWVQTEGDGTANYKVS